MKRGKKYTIIFNDFGQDFLEWDVVGSVVVDSRPFQKSIWAGTLIYEAKKGKNPFVKFKHEKEPCYLKETVKAVR